MNPDAWLVRAALFVLGVWMITRRGRNVVARRRGYESLWTGDPAWQPRQRRIHRLEVVVLLGSAALVVFLLAGVVLVALDFPYQIMWGFLGLAVTGGVIAAVAEMILPWNTSEVFQGSSLGRDSDGRD